MFINTKKTIKIISDNGTVFEAKAGWIGEIPKWVEEHWYFKALCKDGSVTAIVSSKDKDMQQALDRSPKTNKTTAKTAKSTPKNTEPSKADDDGEAVGDTAVSVEVK